MSRYYCFRCEHELSIDDNWMRSDLGLVTEEKNLSDDDAMVTLMSCSYCGASYEVYDTPLSECKNYPYFNEEKDAKQSVV